MKAPRPRPGAAEATAKIDDLDPRVLSRQPAVVQAHPAGQPAVSNSDSKGSSSRSGYPHGSSPADFRFERAAWQLFRSLGTLSQKAGVPEHRLARLVLKELANNTLDAGTHVRVGWTIDGGYVVEDNGPGIPREPEGVARLFSVNRPLISSKLLRLPTRGVLGNGLRVAAVGVVAAGRGPLEIWTRGRHLVLILRVADGGTDVVAEPAPEHMVGTWMVINLDRLPHDPDPLLWAMNAILMAVGTTYSGRASANLYPADAFFELLQAVGDCYARELIAAFDSCTGAKPGKVAHLPPEMMFSSSCLLCGQKLIDPISMARWIGPECAGTNGCSLKELIVRTVDQARLIGARQGHDGREGKR